MRLLCVHLPMWPINRLQRRLRRAGSQPDHLFLIRARASVQYIAACCDASQKCGVRPGMMLAQGRAMVSSAGSAERLHIEDLDPSAERAALLRLAHWSALRYSPIVSIDPCTLSGRISAEEPLPDGLVMNITGCDRLYAGRSGAGEDRASGEVALARHLLERLFLAGFEASIGIGPTIGAAWAAARFGEGGQGGKGRISILSSNQCTLRTQFAAMPARALRIEPDIEQALLELGLDTIGHIMNLPRSSLPSRFGALLTRRIDQAFGSAIELIEPVRPEPPLRLERIFEGPTPQVEAIESCTRELLLQLSRELLHRESGVRLLDAVYERVGRNGRGTEPITQRITLSRPSRDPRHLWSLLRPRIEKLHLGYGIESISLVAVRTARLRHRQEEYVQGAAEASRGASELVDTLANRLGVERILRAEPVESHIPERATKFVPAIDGWHAATARRTSGRGAKRGAPAQTGRGRASLHASSAPAPPAPFSRPTILFETPEPVEALALQPDRPPLRLRWRGEEHRITAAFGPERIGGEWWRVPVRSGPHALPEFSAAPSRDAWERDYFRLSDDLGRWLWVYRETPLVRVQDEAARAPRWFIHGIWA